MPRGEASRKRCAIYTRKSSEEGLDQEFNSLAAQRESCEAYIRSQQHEGWVLSKTRYDDGGFSGGNLERPALQHLLADVRAGRIEIVVVYKVDRLTRSLADFARLVEIFDVQSVSFVSVTQQFNTTSSMGRLTLNVLLSFAQFEREVTGERIRDKIAASKQKGMWRKPDSNRRYRVTQPRFREGLMSPLRLGRAAQTPRKLNGAPAQAYQAVTLARPGVVGTPRTFEVGLHQCPSERNGQMSGCRCARRADVGGRGLPADPTIPRTHRSADPSTRRLPVLW